METMTLEWLPMSQYRILKHIVVITDRNHNESELGSIFYTRELTADYKFTYQKESDQEKGKIGKILNGPSKKTIPVMKRIKLSYRLYKNNIQNPMYVTTHFFSMSI